MTDIYLSFAMIFLVFNLLGWWYKEPFFSWGWFILVLVVHVILQSLVLAIPYNVKVKKSRGVKNG